MNELQLTNEIDQVDRLHDFLDELAPRLGIGQATLMNLKLALEEAVVNIISYAYPDAKNQEIRIQVECADNMLKVVLTDGGIPFNPLEISDPDLTLPVEERPIGGLGIYLVKKLMKEVVYRRTDNKNILTMIKELP